MTWASIVSFYKQETCSVFFNNLTKAMTFFIFSNRFANIYHHMGWEAWCEMSMTACSWLPSLEYLIFLVIFRVGSNWTWRFRHNSMLWRWKGEIWNVNQCSGQTRYGTQSSKCKDNIKLSVEESNENTSRSYLAAWENRKDNFLMIIVHYKIHNALADKQA